MQKEGIDFDELNIIASIENPEVIKRSVKSGMGITILSKLAVQRELELGELLEFPLSKTEEKRDLYLVYNKNYHLSKASEKFVRVAREVYQV
jgi:DNA-binding transcriptional LysR family regulator